MIILLDVSNICYASYHALSRQLRGASPREVALFGFYKTLISRIEALMYYDFVVLCFDTHTGKTWRHSVYPDYKGNRAPTTEEEVKIRQGVHQAIDKLYSDRHHMPWFSCRSDQLEADDLIASVRKVYSDRRAHVVSSDKDMLQLVCLPGTDVYSTKKQSTISSENFMKEVGVAPENYTLYRVLIGDKSDNIKGVEGFGEKSAANFLAYFGNNKADIDRIAAEASVKQLQELMKGAKVRSWKSLAGKLLDPEVLRQMADTRELIDLVGPVGRKPAFNPEKEFVRPSESWDETGRAKLWQFLQDNKLHTVTKKFSTFDFMNTRMERLA